MRTLITLAFLACLTIAAIPVANADDPDSTYCAEVNPYSTPPVYVYECGTQTADGSATKYCVDVNPWSYPYVYVYNAKKLSALYALHNRATRALRAAEA